MFNEPAAFSLDPVSENSLSPLGNETRQPGQPGSGSCCVLIMSLQAAVSTLGLGSMLERPVRVQEIVDEHCRGYPNELMNRRRSFREEHRQDYKSSVAHTQGHERYGIELQTFYPQGS